MGSSWLSTVIPRFLIRLYQTLSAGLPPHCRFAPSCSEYMRQALETEGFFRGFCRGLVRILKCHPWHPGGYDPVERRF